MADGSVIIKVDADEKAAVKKLQQVEREIDKLREKLNEKQSGKSALMQESERLQAQISKLRQQAKAENLKWQGGDAAAGQRESELLAKIPALKKKMEEVNLEIDKYDQKISEITSKIEKQETIYADTQQEVAALAKQNTAMARATEQAQDHMERFASRVKKLAKQVFVFTVISAAFRELRDVMDVAVRGNEEASAAFAQLKGAVLTLVQPLVSLLLPALTWIANALTRVISVLAQLFSMLTGKSFSSTKQAAKNLNAQKKALEGVGSAAEEAKGSLAGFDEINTISTDTGGGGGAGAEIAPSFDFGGKMEMENLKNILELVKLIGLAFLAWKLPGGFAKNLLGLWIALEGLEGYVKWFKDIFDNGMGLDNMLGLLSHALLLVGGLAIAFGKNGVAIGLVITGIGELVAAFKDADTNGWNLYNMLTAIAGIFSVGMGISLLTGSWIPLLIAGIASVLLAITVLTGHGEEMISGLKKVFSGFKDFIAGVFSGDMTKTMAGLSAMWEGLKQVVGAVIAGIKDMLGAFTKWMDEKTGGWFSRFCNKIAQTLAKMVNFIIRGINKLIDGLNSVNISFPEWVPIIGGKKFAPNIRRLSEYRIPALATGTVVPPNREFLAMLGDNKTETEVVSPLSTMKQAMMEALAESGGGGGEITLHLYLNGRKMAVEVVKEINNMTREAGKPVLLF